MVDKLTAEATIIISHTYMVYYSHVLWYENSLMDLIHYSFASLILFRVPYTLDLLLYYLSIANGAGGVVFQCFV